MKNFEYTWDTVNNYIGIIAHAELLNKRGYYYALYTKQG